VARVAIVTDSNAYLAPRLAEQLGVHVLPHTIHLSQGSFKEGSELTASQFYRLLAEGEPGYLPRASGPSIEEFAELYARLGKKTDQILSLHLSSALSDTVRNAQRARNTLLGRLSIEVIDTQSATVGLGMLVQAAATAAKNGRDLDDCVRLARGLMPHIYLFFLVKQLPYLEREHRISSTQSLLGSMLRVMPLLQIEEGEIIPLEKVRSHQRGVDKLYDYVSEFAQLQRATILQHGFESEAKELVSRLKVAYPQQQFPVLTNNPSLAVHLGPEAMGVVVLERLA
jgi:DegV family protein with EDD domain